MKLSVILCNRNDGYGGPDHIERSKLCIDSLQKSMEYKKLEVVVVDYKQVKNTPPLSECYKDFPDIKHIVVTEDKHREIIDHQLSYGAFLVDEESDRPIDRNEVYAYNFLPLSYNIGANASTGDFILLTAMDNIFPSNLGKIINKVRKNIVYRSQRRHVRNVDLLPCYNDILKNKGYHTSDPYIAELDDRRKKIWYSAGDFLLMDRMSLFSTGGFIPVLCPRMNGIDNWISFSAINQGNNMIPLSYEFFNVNVETTGEMSRFSDQYDYGISYGETHFRYRKNTIGDPLFRFYKGMCHRKKFDNEEYYNPKLSKGNFSWIRDICEEISLKETILSNKRVSL